MAIGEAGALRRDGSLLETYIAKATGLNAPNMSWEADSVQGAMAKADAAKKKGEIDVRGAYTSDGTYQGPGRGRLIVSRSYDGKWLYQGPEGKVFPGGDDPKAKAKRTMMGKLGSDRRSESAILSTGERVTFPDKRVAYSPSLKLFATRGHGATLVAKKGGEFIGYVVIEDVPGDFKNVKEWMAAHGNNPINGVRKKCSGKACRTKGFRGASKRPFTDKFFASVVEGYVTAALWSSTDDDGAPLDKNFDETNIVAEAADKMRHDVERFLIEAEDAIREAADKMEKPLNADFAESLGHDLWLSRNGHGAGFWDGDWPEGPAEKLEEAAKSRGSSDLYVGDDGDLYVTP